MNAFDLLLYLALATLLPSLLAPKGRSGGMLTTLAYLLQVWLLFSLLPSVSQGGSVAACLEFAAFGHTIGWQLNGFGWFFALITAVSALIASAYATGGWERQCDHASRLHSLMALNVLAMYLLLGAADLISLFIGWELVSWAGFLLMAAPGGQSVQAALRYLIYALAGALALLTAIVLIEQSSGTIQLDALRGALASLPDGLSWVVLALVFVGFGVKLAMPPFHLWQAPAYGYADGPAAAFLGAISSRMGLFGLCLVLVQMVGLERLVGLALPFSFFDAQSLLAWAAAITLIVPTYIALTQNDARLLLAWHGIGQGGFMLLGLMLGNDLGTAGGLLHVLNHASYQAPLFLAVTAVVYRTGTADLDRLGGLIARMPWAYVTLLLGIIGLAGLPPMNGFVSKWLIYKGLLDAQMPLLFVAAVIGTLGTILSVYKLIHNIFLGQLRAEHREVTDAPWGMTGPMLLIAGFAFISGMLPGLGLYLVEPAAAALGLPMPSFDLSAIHAPNGALDMLVVVSALIGAIGFGALLFLNAGRSYRTQPLDNYAGGHFLTAQTRYQYSHHFYAGLLRVIGPWMRPWLVALEQGSGHFLDLASAASRGLYYHNGLRFLVFGTVVGLLWLLIVV